MVRRDNIGDLVCTTPLISGLRRCYPHAWIGILVNSYNAPVVEGNPDIDEVISYTKLKHLQGRENALGAIAHRLSSWWRLRRSGIDTVVLATSDFSPRLLRLARWLGAREIAGFSDGSRRAARLDISVPIDSLAGLHEVERVFSIARALGVQGSIPPLRLAPRPQELRKARAAFDRLPGGAVVALHISARRPAQRWPAERFAQLAGHLIAAHGARIVLLWSPGASNHPRHPGDDDKVADIMARLPAQTVVLPYSTQTLPELIGALSAADRVVCSDGGASHIAAALGKPMVCLFGDSPAQRWRPWGVPARVLQPDSHQVADLGVEEVADAYRSLASP